MSDDDHYESPYEDFNDILYEADEVPDLADDLAEHAAHSPVWQDEPVGELRYYFSDWEYYSDDYYDDDPNILRKQPADGSRATNDGASSKPHGRKRKLSEAREPSELRDMELRALASCLRGTVWATGSPDRIVEYTPGQQQKIALTLNKNIMQSAYSYQRGFGKRKVRTDESWANDLSLNEMGLQLERQSSMKQEPDANDAEDDLAEEDDESEDEDDENVAQLAMHNRPTKRSAQENGYDSESNRNDEAGMADSEDNTGGRRRRKRQKPDSSSHVADEDNTAKHNAKVNARQSTRKAGFSKKATSSNDPDVDVNDVLAEEQPPAKTRAKRKRDGEEEAEKDDVSTKVTNGRASKRIASARIAETVKEESTTARTRRSRRN